MIQEVCDCHERKFSQLGTPEEEFQGVLGNPPTSNKTGLAVRRYSKPKARQHNSQHNSYDIHSGKFPHSAGSQFWCRMILEFPEIVSCWRIHLPPRLFLPDRWPSPTEYAGYPRRHSVFRLRQWIPYTRGYGRWQRDRQKIQGWRLMMSPRKLTLLSVLLFCATWMVAQAAPGGGATPGGSGTPGQSSPSTPPTGNTGQPPTGSTAPPPTGSTTPGSSATPGSNPTNPNGSPSTPGSPSNPGAQPDGGTTNPDTSNPGSTPGSSNPGGSNPGSANPGGTPPGR